MNRRFLLPLLSALIILSTASQAKSSGITIELSKETGEILVVERSEDSSAFTIRQGVPPNLINRETQAISINKDGGSIDVDFTDGSHLFVPTPFSPRQVALLTSIDGSKHEVEITTRDSSSATRQSLTSSTETPQTIADSPQIQNAKMIVHSVFKDSQGNWIVRMDDSSISGGNTLFWGPANSTQLEQLSNGSASDTGYFFAANINVNSTANPNIPNKIQLDFSRRIGSASFSLGSRKFVQLSRSDSDSIQTFIRLGVLTLKRIPPRQTVVSVLQVPGTSQYFIYELIITDSNFTDRLFQSKNGVVSQIEVSQFIHLKDGGTVEIKFKNGNSIKIPPSFANRPATFHYAHPDMEPISLLAKPVGTAGALGYK